MALSAAATNLLFILSILKTQSLHNPSNVLLCFLALSDFCVGFVVQPLFICMVVFEQNASMFLSAMSMASILLHGASILTMMVIAIDRYLALVLHLRYRTIVTVTRLVKSKLLLYFLCLSGYLFRYTLPKNIRYISIIIVNLICICISSYCYVQIIRIVRRHRRQIMDQALSIAQQFSPSSVPTIKQGKSITTMYYIHGFFIFCIVPYLIGIVLLLKVGSIPSIIVYRYCAWIALTLNSVLNPFLYCWRNQSIRVAVRRLVKSIFDVLTLKRYSHDKRA